MPDLIAIPETASQAEIIDIADRAELGDLLIIGDRVFGVIARTASAITGPPTDAKLCRRYFGAIDSIIASADSPIKTPEEAAKYLVNHGIIAKKSEWTATRLARLYRQDRRIVRQNT